MNWRILPAGLRRTAANIAIMRIGILGYLALIVLSLSQSAATSTPAAFAAALFSVNSLFAVVILVMAPILLCWWAMTVAPRYVEAYARMMPENADEIRQMFVERGVADVIAPWIMTRPGRMKAVLTRIAGRLLPPQ